MPATSRSRLVTACAFSAGLAVAAIATTRAAQCVDLSTDPAGCQPSTLDTPIGQMPSVRVNRQGHTDATGPDDINFRLGEARAEAVRRYLNKQGVALNRMSTISYGKNEPVETNKTREGRSKNRRVVVIVLA